MATGSVSDGGLDLLGKKVGVEEGGDLVGLEEGVEPCGLMEEGEAGEFAQILCGLATAFGAEGGGEVGEAIQQVNGKMLDGFCGSATAEGSKFLSC